MKLTKKHIFWLTIALLLLLMGSDYYFMQQDMTAMPHVKTEKAIKTINESLKQGKLPDALIWHIKGALTPWERNPFLNPVLLQPKTKKEQGHKELPKVDVVYYGYIQKKNRLYVVLNGRQYVKGEIVDGTTLQIVACSPVSVSLRNINPYIESDGVIVIPIQSEAVMTSNDIAPQEP
ncbi:hypothetical protein [Halodesulfovibrio sp.]|uniref:hypothetical protein n=1 Tax=Halodesulfovibrio sp. TaxID=1912772 RepID=UPI0025DA0004|nr:hypothetical protein [Halodesulfovibrio sp.]MCT4627891.1 hypothetical protein [Halodesulfovibrio sp.]